MKVSDFNYELPAELIAQYPLAERDASRLLVLDRRTRRWVDRRFRDLPELVRGDELVVFNNARVIPARLIGRRIGVHSDAPGTRSRATRKFLQAPIEVFLTRRISEDIWEALVRPGRKMATGERVLFGDGALEAEVIAREEYGVRRVRLRASGDLLEAIEQLGHIPLPPYINRPDEPSDRERYQTVFARAPGAVAAPTAGLHFTPEILNRLHGRGVEICEITLQVGLGTFQPIRSEYLEGHRMHTEAYEISTQAADQISRARREKRPILAIGTTVVRALEDAARKASSSRGVTAAEGLPLSSPDKSAAELFIYPGYEFRVVDQLLTNFHLPRSTLLAMVSALAGRGFLLEAYRHAIKQRYRFYSYGDCMLIR